MPVIVPGIEAIIVPDCSVDRPVVVFHRYRLFLPVSGDRNWKV